MQSNVRFVFSIKSREESQIDQEYFVQSTYRRLAFLPSELLDGPLFQKGIDSLLEL